MGSPREVVGRTSEIRSVHAFLDGIGAGTSALLLDGAIGIGKTTVWREGVAAASRRGQRVLGCRPVEAEIALPFAALGDLLEHVDDQRLALLPEPQREALQVALLRSEAHGRPLLGRAVALGLLGVLRGLA